MRTALIFPSMLGAENADFLVEANAFRTANIRLPHKKPKGKELTEAQKQENQEFSRQRVVCEHAPARVKRYQAVSAVYRNRVPDFDDRLVVTAARLWNLYLEVA